MTSPGSRQPSGPVRTFGIQDPDTSAAHQESPSSSEPNVARRILGRISFGSLHKKPSPLLSRPRDVEGDSTSSPSATGRPPVPTVMQPSGETYTTPLPLLSMIVLSIVRVSFPRICLCLTHPITDYVGRVSFCQRFHPIPSFHGQRCAQCLAF